MALDDQPTRPRDVDLGRGAGGGEPYHMTDAFSDYAVRFIDQHAAEHADRPFFLYLAYTAPHWPLHARPADVERYKGKYMSGWDTLRQQRRDRMIKLGIVDANWPMTPRDPSVPAWDSLTMAEREAWDGGHAGPGATP